MACIEPRFAMDQPVVYRVDQNGGWHNGRTRNVSRSGMLFSCEAYLEVGAVIEIRILNPEPADGLIAIGEPCFAEVVRRVLMPWPEILNLIGVRFVEIETAGRTPQVLRT